MEEQYGMEELLSHVKSDFDWGMLSGKMSAIRWVLGEDWDMLDNGSDCPSAQTTSIDLIADSSHRGAQRLGLSMPALKACQRRQTLGAPKTSGETRDRE
jgi:hypothetical protein